MARVLYPADVYAVHTTDPESAPLMSTLTTQRAPSEGSVAPSNEKKGIKT